MVIESGRLYDLKCLCKVSFVSSILFELVTSAKLVLDKSYVVSSSTACSGAGYIVFPSKIFSNSDNLDDIIQRIKVPFQCEVDIVAWEVEAFEID